MCKYVSPSLTSFRGQVRAVQYRANIKGILPGVLEKGTENSLFLFFSFLSGQLVILPTLSNITTTEANAECISPTMQREPHNSLPQQLLQEEAEFYGCAGAGEEKEAVACNWDSILVGGTVSG